MTETGGGTRLRPLAVGEILDAAVKLYRRNFGTLTLAVLVLVLPISIIDTLITASTSEGAFDFSTETTTIDDEGSFIAGRLASGLLSLLSFAVATAACFYAVMRDYLGERVTWKESLSFGLRRLVPVVLLALLVILVLIPAFVLLIIPGIWLAVRLAVSAPALLAERIGPAAAIGRSFRLVGGRWWPTFAALLAMTILVSILQALVGALIGVVFADVDNEVLAASVLTVVTALAYAITLPIQAAVFTLLYYDLRVRKEGFDLQLMAEGMGSSSAAPPPPPAPDSSWSEAPESPAPAPAQPGGGFAPPQAPVSTPPPPAPPAEPEAPPRQA